MKVADSLVILLSQRRYVQCLPTKPQMSSLVANKWLAHSILVLTICFIKMYTNIDSKHHYKTY